MNNYESKSARSPSAVTLGLCLFSLAIVFLLWAEHRAHLFGALPLLILLACPLIHMFMHRGHGAGRHGNGGVRGDADVPHSHGERP